MHSHEIGKLLLGQAFVLPFFVFVMPGLDLGIHAEVALAQRSHRRFAC